jgi:hypothetical protein
LPDNIADQEIKTDDVCHSEPLVSDFNDPGFGQFNIPLLFKPLGNITVDAYIVQKDSAADIALKSAVDSTSANVEVFTTDRCSTTISGFQSSSLQSSIPTSVLGHSTVLVDQSTGGIDEIQIGTPVVNAVGVSYNRDNNTLNVVFDHFLDFSRDEIVYIFATYERRKIILPADLADLRSNRFDINVLLFKDGEQPTSDVHDFLLEFLFRFKAFHSLLRKITFTIEADAIYNVQDFCIGGRQAQSPDFDLGQLQVPPPVIPNIVLSPDDTGFECDQALLDPGFKKSDLDLRNKILRLLEEEHAAWKNLDETHQVPSGLLPILQSASRIKIRLPDDGSCQFTQFGQDRVLNNPIDFDHNDDARSKLCDLEGNVQDYCYKGRVQQEVDLDPVLVLEEIFRCKPCELMPGLGEYFLTPLVLNNELSGGDKGPNLTNVVNYNRSGHDRGYVRLMAFDNPQLHYNDRSFLGNFDDVINNRFFATRKPSLEIQKDNLMFPGHRFISMANLENNFVHPDYRLRPWDPVFDMCPEDLPDGFSIPDLDAQVLDGSDSQILVFNDEDLIYFGNGIPADIPSGDDHTLSSISNNRVTHSIWSSTSPGLCWSRGITEGSLVDYAIKHREDGLRFPTEALGVQKDTICFTDSIGPIFESADSDCPCPDGNNVHIAFDLEDVETTAGTNLTGTGTDVTGTSTGGADFIDGYPAEFGSYTVNLVDFDFPRETLAGYGFDKYGVDVYRDIGGITQFGPSIALGLPLLDNPGTPRELLFRVSSGIRVEQSDIDARFYEPLRLDCGCEKFECPSLEITAEAVVTSGGFGQLGHGVLNFGGTPVTASSEEDVFTRCPVNSFQLSDGSFDFNCDRVEIIPTMILEESYGAKTCILDGSIPNMMSFDDQKEVFRTILTAFGERFPEEGSFQFIDDYGVIYRAIFETFNDRLDYTLQTQDPRVWGETATGEIKNRRVFRDGIVTNERQIIQVSDVGYMILAEGFNQVQNRFQTTFGCGDDIFENPFAFTLDNAIVDDVIFVITPVSGSAPIIVGDFGDDDFGEADFGG